MATPPDADAGEPRSALAVGSGAQAGDVSARDVAGQSIYHGLSGEHLRQLMQQQTEFYMTLVGAYEKQYQDVTKQLQRLRDEQDIYRVMDQSQRIARQTSHDSLMLTMRRRITWLLVLIVALVVVLGLLVWRLGPLLWPRLGLGGWYG